jgi:hypothetical protein
MSFLSFVRLLHSRSSPHSFTPPTYVNSKFDVSTSRIPLCFPTSFLIPSSYSYFTFLSFILRFTLSSVLRRSCIHDLRYVCLRFFLLASEGSGVFNIVYINRFLVFDTQLSIRIPGRYNTILLTLLIHTVPSKTVRMFNTCVFDSV